MATDILSIGARALMNYQAAIQVTGSNVSNESVEGYSRRTVSFTSSTSLDTGTVRIGQGADIDRIVRNFDSYLEARNLAQNGEASAKEAAYNGLSGVESLFVDDEDDGTSTLLDKFWSAWSDLAENPNDEGTRTALIGVAQTLTERLNGQSSSLKAAADSLEQTAASDVDDVNGLVKQLAALNGRISCTTVDSSLLDGRDKLLTNLSAKIGISVSYEDDGQVSVSTSSGLSLVEGDQCHTLSWEGPQVTSSLTPSSVFDGSLYFEGNSGEEYTLEVVSGGSATGGSGAASFKVSLDGGASWLTDDDGNVRAFTAGDSESKVDLNGVSVWFGDSSVSSTPASTDLTTGDRFTVVPKSSLYWNRSDASKVNIDPLEGNEQASNRITGGSLSGELQARDACIGEYTSNLDTVARSIIWEVNRLHGQGTGLDHRSSVQGGYRAQTTDIPMNQSGLAFADRLTRGGLSFAFYDASTGDAHGVSSVDFTSVTGKATFDPATDSLEDVRDAINASCTGKLNASINNGALVLTADSSVQFEFADDSSGLLAGLGLNTFLTGTNARSIGVDPAVVYDADRICAGSVNSAGESSDGDNSMATKLAGLADNVVTVRTLTGSSQTTIGKLYAGLVSGIGSDTASAQTDWQYSDALATSLNNQQEAIGGVSLDEEMAMLTKYQQGYQAASQLIAASKSMFDVLMSIGS